MTFHKYFLAVPALLWAASSQAGQVRGMVCDENHEPLIGASVYWAGTNVGTVTGTDGTFGLHTVKDYNKLVVSYIGYRPDTVDVAGDTTTLAIHLTPSTTLGEVVVEGTQRGNSLLAKSIYKTENLSFTGLTKLACCTVAESFENSASVTVGYSDAISGARQIKMLGLAGTYTQMLDESRPVMRGLSAPYGMTYVPGMWLNSIQVSKGVSSVTAGHDAVTGQINLEYRKPTDEERLFVNAYLDDMLRPELNITSAIPLTRDKRLSTIVMAHGSLDTDWREMRHMDLNRDGFRDQPSDRKINLANRWIYITKGGMQLRWGWHLLADGRTGGMLHYKDNAAMRQAMAEDWAAAGTMYGSHIANREAGGYFKVALPVGTGIYDEQSKTEKRSNVALVADFTHFNEKAYFGLNDYYGNQNSITANLMYSHYFDLKSSLVVGAQSRLDYYREHLLGATPWIAAAPSTFYNMNRDEREVGGYAEYTLDIKDKFTLVAGLRGDYNDLADRFFVTPRGHVKWNILPKTTLRASAGLGYRMTDIVADNIGILATGRQILINGGHTAYADLDRMEKALTVGGSLTQNFVLGNDQNASLSFDYFRTRFYKTLVVDQEWNPAAINIYESDRLSYTDSYQLDFNWTPFTRFDVFATFRYTTSRMTIDRPDGTTARVERPLINQFKTLLNLSYATKFRMWVFDVTGQLNGKARIPSATGDLAHDSHSPVYPMLFAQVTHKIGRADVYLGCENITDYRQKVPIASADNPFSTQFNSMNVWGPLMGRKFYVGVRFNLY